MKLFGRIGGLVDLLDSAIEPRSVWENGLKATKNSSCQQRLLLFDALGGLATLLQTPRQLFDVRGIRFA